MIEDKAYLDRYRNGDVSALEVLVEEYRRPLFGFILRMIGPQEEAEEIFQEVWIRAIRNLHSFDSRKLLSWLFRIAQNVIIDRSRKHRPDASLQDLVGDGRTRGEEIAATQPSPMEHAAATDVRSQISAAVQRLPDEQRSVFLMRMEAGLSFKQIARIQSISINTALARMRYAVEKLRVELQDEYAP